MARDNAKREIARLKKENKELKRKNEYLSHRLARFSPGEAKNITRERELFQKSERVERAHGYFRYLFGLFKLTLVYRIYDRTFFALRKYILASKIWRNTVIILAVFGTSLQAVLTFGSVLVLLPATVMGAVLFALLSAYSYGKMKTKLLSCLSGKRVYFLYPAARPRKNGAFYESMRLFSADGAVIAVTHSPALCAWRAVRKLYGNVYFIHTSFYYTLIKAMIKNGKNEIIKIF
ncbi:MAG: hypothetical protein J6C89_03340 [Clostridia bacterium]|nr:hypothetical protein [Clostridia bacterium]